MAMRSRSHRRRRRRRSVNARVAPPLRATPAGRQVRLRTAELLASLGVAVAAAALIALFWLAEARSIETSDNDLRARIEATVGGQAAVLADEIHRELLGVDQSLRILRQAFQADPDQFDMHAWHDQMPALTDIVEDAFVADAQFVIRHDINPGQVGQRVGSSVPGMGAPGADKPDLDQGPFGGPAMQTLPTRQQTLLMVMRLDRPGGWIVGAAYRTPALRRLFTEANLGVQGMTALVDTRLGRVPVVVGPAAATPDYDIANSPMYGAMQRRPDGTWIGPSAVDGVRRIHAFHGVPGHQLSVIVAVDEPEAMRPALGLAQDVRETAVLATALVLAAAGIALYAIWTLRSKHRLRQSLERERLLVANTQAELAETRMRLGTAAGRAHALFAAASEGVAVLDGQLRLVEWNRYFPERFGIAPEAAQIGRPLDELLRTQARAGAFGAPADPEADVARRLAELTSGDGAAPVLYAGPDARELAVFTSRHADGSMLLVVREATGREICAAREASAEPVLETVPPGSAETF